jgi:hypothetical protein
VQSEPERSVHVAFVSVAQVRKTVLSMCW